MKHEKHAACTGRQTPPQALSPQMETMGLLLLVTRLHHSAIERRVASLGIHHSQHRMLMRLSRPDVPDSQRELADAMNISPAAVTATLKALEKEGYISRTMGNDDNRRNTVRITDEGLRKVEESRRIFDTMDRAAFSGFSDEELSQLNALLERMAGNIRAAEAGDSAENGGTAGSGRTEN